MMAHVLAVEVPFESQRIVERAHQSREPHSINYSRASQRRTMKQSWETQEALLDAEKALSMLQEEELERLT